MENQDRKKAILLLRWTSIIVTSYLILLGKGKVADPQLSNIFIVGYILSNLFLTFLPKIWFSNTKFFYSLLLIDTAIISLGMYLSEKWPLIFIWFFS